MTRKKLDAGSAPRSAVLFTGAGASAACGYPVTAEILPLIVERLRGGGFGDPHIDKARDELSTLLGIFVPTSQRQAMPLITEVLSIIDHCLESGEELFSADVGSPLRLRDARWLLERAVANVIGRIHKPEVRTGQIVKWVQSKQKGGVQVAVVSTNYDYSLDRALFKYQLGDWNLNYHRIDLGFTWRDPDDGELVPPNSDPLVKLYKLHGSLNWLTCRRCGHVMVSFMYPIVKNAEGNSKYAQCWCDYMPMRAVLVAPSLVRSYRDPNLMSVWRGATEAMRLADEWVFVGYSMPAEDVAVRAMMVRALCGRESLPKVEVVSRSVNAMQTYRRMLPACRYTASGLKSYLSGECVWEE
jgi:NAD-dependent SIR2 family protein deacetylase